jgi:hypothetical protein
MDMKATGETIARKSTGNRFLLLGAIAALAIAASAIAPGLASAGPSGVRLVEDLGSCDDEGYCSTSFDLEVAAAAGEAASHQITVSSTAATFIVRDAAGATAGSQCTQVDPNTVSCPSLGQSSCCPPQLLWAVNEIKVTGGSAADSIDLSALSLSGTVFARGGSDQILGGSGSSFLKGGAGNDRIAGNGGRDDLSGGRGNDRLDGGSGPDVVAGGPGADYLRGGAGNDELYTRDHQRDRRIDCGPGSNRREGARRDRNDPNAISC